MFSGLFPPTGWDPQWTVSPGQLGQTPAGELARCGDAFWLVDRQTWGNEAGQGGDAGRGTRSGGGSTSFPSLRPAHVFHLAASELCPFCCLVIKLCPTLCDLMDRSPPGFSVHGIFQARIQE